MTMNKRTKAILITAILGCGVLVACGTSTSAPGGSASIALAQAHATATAEVAQTATAMIAEANRRNEEALARMTAVASAGMQSTLTVQEQQINDLAIAQAKANATQQAQLFRATVTAVSVQKTAQADALSGTATAIAVGRGNDEGQSRFQNWVYLIIIGFLILGLLALSGFLILIGWRFVVRHSFIPNPNGAGGVVVEFSPFDLLKLRDARTPSYQLLLPAGASTPSAAPDEPKQLEFAPMKIRDLSGRETVVNRLDDSYLKEMEAEWTATKKRMLEFCTAVFAQAREKANYESNAIPRWDSLNGVDGIAVNTEYWTEMTTLLEEQGIINPKRQGKQTTLNAEKCKTVVDLALLATRDKILPSSPTSAWKQMRKYRRNSTEQHSSEQSKQSEQSRGNIIDNGALDSAVWALPAVDHSS